MKPTPSIATLQPQRSIGTTPIAVHVTARDDLAEAALENVHSSTAREDLAWLSDSVDHRDLHLAERVA